MFKKLFKSKETPQEIVKETPQELKETIVLKDENTVEEEIKILKTLKSLSVKENQIRDLENKIKNKQKGNKGEEEILRTLKLSTVPKYIIRDLYLNTGEFTAQIDFLIITKNRIYEIESKNNNGNATITENGEIHIKTQSTEYKMHSPVNQVLEHKGVINTIIENKNLQVNFLELYKPLVVISNKACSIDVTKASDTMKSIVISIENLLLTLEEDSKDTTNLMSKKEMENLGQFFLQNHQTTMSTTMKNYEQMIKQQQIKPQPQVKPQPAPQPQPTPQPQAKPQPTPQPQAKPQPTPQPQAKPQPAPQPQAKPQPTPQPQAKPQPTPQPQAKPKSAPQPKETTQEKPKQTKTYCEKCGSEKVRKINGKTKQPFMSCANYKICKELEAIRPTCKKDNKKMVVRANKKTGEIFYACPTYNCSMSPIPSKFQDKKEPQ